MTTTKPDFMYVTYIATTPEAVWQALVDPAVTGGTGPARRSRLT
jgi:hypothetical protein